MSKKKSGGHAKRAKRGIGFFIFPFISLIIAAVCIMYIINWSRENGINKEVMETITQEVVETNEETGEVKVDFNKLKQKNKDTIRLVKGK